MRVLGVLAIVQVARAFLVPSDIIPVLNHRPNSRGVTDLTSLKKELQTLASLHVAKNWKIERAEEASWGRGSLTSASHILSRLSTFPSLDRFTSLGQQLQQDFVSLLMANVNLSSLAGEVTRSRKKREESGVMYLPVRGGGTASCPSYADTVSASLTQMAFASMAVTVFNAVFNVMNNINNNNNNNNINSNSNLASNNANAATNNNNGNQVDVVLPPSIPGRRRRHSRTVAWIPEASAAVGSHVAASHTRDSRYLSHGRSFESQGVDGCLSRKTSARAALATLRNLQDILDDPVIPIRLMNKTDRGGAVLSQ